MKNLVVYSSQSGNTRRLAEELFKHLPEGADIVAVAEAPDPKGYDVIALGFWFKAGGPDPAAQEFLKKCVGKKLFLFATHAIAPGSEGTAYGMNKARELAPGATVLGTFSCYGEVPGKVKETMANKNPQPPWLAGAGKADGHPDQADFNGLADALEAAGLKAKKQPGEARMFS